MPRATASLKSEDSVKIKKTRPIPVTWPRKSGSVIVWLALSMAIALANVFGMPVAAAGRVLVAHAAIARTAITSLVAKRDLGTLLGSIGFVLPATSGVTITVNVVRAAAARQRRIRPL